MRTADVGKGLRENELELAGLQLLQSTEPVSYKQKPLFGLRTGHGWAARRDN